MLPCFAKMGLPLIKSGGTALASLLTLLLCSAAAAGGGTAGTTVPRGDEKPTSALRLRRGPDLPPRSRWVPGAPSAHDFPLVARAILDGDAAAAPDGLEVLGIAHLDRMGRGKWDAVTGDVAHAFMLHDWDEWSELRSALGDGGSGSDSSAPRLWVDEGQTALLRLDESEPEPEPPRDGGRALPQSAYDAMPLRPCYRTVDSTHRTMLDLEAARPDLATLVRMGESHEGDGMFVLRLTDSNSAVPLDGRAPMLVTAGLHAREYAPPEIIARLAEYLVYYHGSGANADVDWILGHVQLHLLMHSNPDSRRIAERNDGQYQPRKNRNGLDGDGCSYANLGVDLNRNFDFMWGDEGGSSGHSCAGTYRGRNTASEKETCAMQDYSESIFPAGQRKFDPAKDVDVPYDEGTSRCRERF